ncbi:MAG TPA: hypothetical protein VFS00_13245, partial [Polyangiaceae bacterium]|nr:hypothetical protein [Polyangiaceae bacterium]
AEVPLPQLWALTPTSPAELLAGFRALPSEGLPPGCFGLAPELGLTLVVLAALPEGPETLWLRLLGRGEVQRRALDELAGLPDEHPLHRGTTQRMLRWSQEAKQTANPSEADRELIMNTERWVAQWERRLLHQGKAEGLRVAVLDLCELLGIEPGPAERERLEAMGLDELEALRRAVKQERRWPEAKGR